MLRGQERGARPWLHTAARMGLVWGLAVAWHAGATAQNLVELRQTGAKIAADHCAACHGQDGLGLTDRFPRLAGQNRQYLTKQLQDFASGRRVSSIMTDKAKLLDASNIAALAVHYEGLPNVPPPTSDALLAGVGRYLYERGNPFAGVPACLACHGTDGRGTAELPRLAGQHAAYLEAQLNRFATKDRQNDQSIMNLVSSRMGELERKAVAEYLGSMK